MTVCHVVTGRVQCRTVYLLSATVCRLLQLDCDSLSSSDRAYPVSDSVFIVCDSSSSSDQAYPVSDSVFMVCDSLLSSSDRLMMSRSNSLSSATVRL